MNAIMHNGKIVGVRMAAVCLQNKAGFPGQPWAEAGPAAYAAFGYLEQSVQLATASEHAQFSETQLITWRPMMPAERLNAAANTLGEFSTPRRAARNWLGATIHDAGGLSPVEIGRLCRSVMNKMDERGRLIIWPIERLFPKNWTIDQTVSFLASAAFDLPAVLPTIEITLRPIKSHAVSP